jgi:hypothetical protein
MACNCSKKKNTVEYVVTYPDGSTVTQNSELEARNLATRVGGRYSARTKQPA